MRGVIVTGGGSGIGAETCRYLAEQGIPGGVLDHDEAAARAVAAQIGGTALIADIGDSAAVSRAVAEADSAWGGVAGLVNNAGVGQVKLLEDYSDAEWDLLLRVNLTGAWLLTKAVAPLMRAGG